MAGGSNLRVGTELDPKGTPLASHWIALSIFVVLALAWDLRSGAAAAPSLRSATIWSIVWTAIGVAFGGVLLIWDGSTEAGQYLTGFLIEKSLSLDNLFVFAVLFSVLLDPRLRAPAGARARHRGRDPAAYDRSSWPASAVLNQIDWFTYVLGCAAGSSPPTRSTRHGRGGGRPRPDADHEGDAPRACRCHGRASTERSSFTDKQHGKRLATPLMAAFLMVAAFDVMFAIDSIPAAFAITRDTFIVFAANAFSAAGDGQPLLPARRPAGSASATSRRASP